MELHALPVINTSHLTKDVFDRLTDDGNNNPWCSCSAWAHGFFLRIDELEEHPADSKPTPQCLIDIRDWLRAQNLHESDGKKRVVSEWVRLDNYATTADGLTSYRW